MRKALSVAIKFFIIIFCVFFILHSDRFQEFFFPKEFWKKKSHELLLQVKSVECKEKSLLLSLEREKALLRHELTCVEDLAQIEGKEESEVREKILSEAKRRMKDLDHQIDDVVTKKTKKETSLHEAIKRHHESEEALLWRIVPMMKKMTSEESSETL